MITRKHSNGSLVRSRDGECSQRRKAILAVPFCAPIALRDTQAMLETILRFVGLDELLETDKDICSSCGHDCSDETDQTRECMQETFVVRICPICGNLKVRG